MTLPVTLPGLACCDWYCSRKSVYSLKASAWAASRLALVATVTGQVTKLLQYDKRGEMSAWEIQSSSTAPAAVGGGQVSKQGVRSEGGKFRQFGQWHCFT